MDFFAQQARVRGSSRRLVVLFVLAVAAIVAGIDAAVWLALGHHVGLDGEPARSNLPLLLGSSVVVLAGIGLASLYRIASLSGGGRKVAEDMGGTLVPPEVADPALRRLRNVVEEVAIASGVPVPEIYVMEGESGINAFAAGYSVADAAVCVTRGCLDSLDRDELQGVVAHEFSHVLNGDMRLNIRLMGLLFGILVLAVVGRQIVYSGGYRSSRRDSGNQTMLIGLALMVVGYIGYFFARLIQAAVARSRESLADASAVQFTRQTAGIAGALKKIAVADEGSMLQAANRHEVSHMLFGEADRFNALFASHPPLLERIRALEPGFREEELAEFAARAARAEVAAEEPASPPASPRSAASLAGTMPLPPAMPAAAAVPLAAAAAGGDWQRAAALRQSIPPEMQQAVRQGETALATVLALVLSGEPELLQHQQRILANAFGDDVAQAVQQQAAITATLAPGLRLPLAALAFPALRQLPVGRQDTLLGALDALVRADGGVGLEEYCLVRFVRVHLLEARAPRSTPVDGLRKLPACRASLMLVCAVLAVYGQHDADAQRRAWIMAMQQAFPGEPLEWSPPPAAWQAPFEQALADLDGLQPPAKELAVQSFVGVVRADGVVTAAEADLLRVICASLHCPLPI
jgi:Zn-dependent protease with chaperone function